MVILTNIQLSCKNTLNRDCSCLTRGKLCQNYARNKKLDMLQRLYKTPLNRLMRQYTMGLSDSDTEQWPKMDIPFTSNNKKVPPLRKDIV